MEKEKKSGKVVTILVVLGIIAYLLLFYPFMVKVENGETTCKSILGLTIDCR